MQRAQTLKEEAEWEERIRTARAPIDKQIKEVQAQINAARAEVSCLNGADLKLLTL